jgi:hypothetical protein
VDNIDLKSFILGVGVAFAFGLLSQQIRLARKAFGGYYSPQNAQVKTRESPAKVASGCTLAILRLLLVIAILGLGGYAAWKYLM